MATGRNNLSSSGDETSSTSSSGLSGDALSYTNTHGVLTWIKPRTDAFWKRFSFPPVFHVNV